MSILSRLFGRKTPDVETTDGEAEEYAGFTIVPAPRKEGGSYRISGRISKTVDGQERTHEFVRADTISELEDARSATLAKARQLIDEQGTRLFDDGR